jgi:hypothetical protein
MNVKKIVAVLGAVALVTVSGVFAAGTALAQSATPPAQTAPAGPGAPSADRGMDFGFGFGGGSWTQFDAAAKALNLTPTQLFEALHGGKSMSDIATSQGVELQKVQDAVNAVRTQAMKDNIAQAVKDGRMTQAQADWLLEGISKGYSDGGMGFGPGMGGGKPGRGHGMPPAGAPTTTPQS